MSIESQLPSTLVYVQAPVQLWTVVPCSDHVHKLTYRAIIMMAIIAADPRSPFIPFIA